MPHPPALLLKRKAKQPLQRKYTCNSNTDKYIDSTEREYSKEKKEYINILCVRQTYTYLYGSLNLSTSLVPIYNNTNIYNINIAVNIHVKNVNVLEVVVIVKVVLINIIEEVVCDLRLAPDVPPSRRRNGHWF